jgi:DNA-binding transcriptional ArsR family regulator
MLAIPKRLGKTNGVGLLAGLVRLRIVQAVLDGHPLTTTQLRARMPDVSPATVYRHVALLTDAGVLKVVEEQRVRGAVERTYRLHREGAEIDPEAIAAMAPDDHRRAFTAFVAGLLADFDRYLGDEVSVDPRADGVTYRQAALWLTNEELDALRSELRAVITSRIGQGRGAGRARFLLSMILLPADPAGTA